MVRRLFTILWIFGVLLIAVGGVLVYFTFPIWLLVWFGTGWWIYPPASALAENIMTWFMVRSTQKSWLSDKHYEKDYYKKNKKSLKTQKF